MGTKLEDGARIIFNCELPLSNSIYPVPRLRGPRAVSHPNTANVLINWSPGFALLATNHILDAGREGLVDTINFLNRAGFQVIGAGLTETDLKKPLFWETIEGRLAIVNWVFPETNPEWNVIPGPNCWPGIDNARKVINKLKNEADWVMVQAHWSDELFPYPRPEDRATARGLIEAGADLLIGHHPHVVRGMEIINGKPVFYSLGNFFFCDLNTVKGDVIFRPSPRNREAMVVRIDLKSKQAPEYEVFSFWQGKKETRLDPFKRATRRMRLVSQPLVKYAEGEYSAWYQKRRNLFDRFEYRIIFSPWQKGWKGFVRDFPNLVVRALKASK